MPILVGPDIVGQYEKILLYGHGGSGKTYTAGTMPGVVYVIVFGGVNEIKTYQSQDFLKKYPKKKIFYDFAIEPVGKRGHFKSADAFDMACDLLDAALEAEAAGDLSFDSVVIDSATGLRTFAMNKAMEVNFHRASGGSKTALDRLRKDNIIIPGDNDYMSEMSLTTQFMDWVFRLDKHVCVTTHVHEAKSFNRATREVTIEYARPLFTGNNRESIPTMFDNVWYVEPQIKGQGIQATLHTVPTTDRYGKTRMGGVLPPLIRDPNLEKLIEKMKASVK